MPLKDREYSTYCCTNREKLLASSGQIHLTCSHPKMTATLKLCLESKLVAWASCGVSRDEHLPSQAGPEQGGMNYCPVLNRASSLSDCNRS